MEMTWLETFELLGIDLLAALLLAVVVLDLLEHGMHAVGILRTRRDEPCADCDETFPACGTRG